jgi:hypothetical protein
MKTNEFNLKRKHKEKDMPEKTDKIAADEKKQDSTAGKELLEGIDPKSSIHEKGVIYNQPKYPCKGVNIEYVHPADMINGIYAGQELWLRAKLDDGINRDDFTFKWSIDSGDFKGTPTRIEGTRLETVENLQTVCIATNAVPPGGEIGVLLTAISKNKKPEVTYQCPERVPVRTPSYSDLKGNFDQKLDDVTESIRSSNLNDGHLNVSLQRTSIAPTDDLGLWVIIRRSAQAMSFNNYLNFMDTVLSGSDGNGNTVPAAVSDNPQYQYLRQIRALPFNDTDAYRLLKTATEAFLLVNSGVPLNGNFPFVQADIDALNARMGSSDSLANFNASWNRYLGTVLGVNNPMLPYLALIRQRFAGAPLKRQIFLNEDPTLLGANPNQSEPYYGLLQRKLTQPFLQELIWSYWHEEGMLVQTINAVARRFQNIRIPTGECNTLANLEIDPLRPLNNLLWGYVQDEQHRLSIVRRAYEYEHQYGIALRGRAIRKLRPADSRSKFIEAFHHLLHLCSVFYRQDDDTTVNSDGFSVLNSLREVHLILSHGAHNQFGDLPSTARQEMLLQQWILSRPEFREFMPTRVMVAYSEPWMGTVDSMKSLQGWTDISVDHFHRLAVFGEQILLSIRFGAWGDINQNSPSAANWARFWRAEIQGYIHDYRAVTGVDLASSSKIDSTPPSVHLYNRYMAQSRRL